MKTTLITLLVITVLAFLIAFNVLLIKVLGWPLYIMLNIIMTVQGIIRYNAYDEYASNMQKIQHHINSVHARR